MSHQLIGQMVPQRPNMRGSGNIGCFGCFVCHVIAREKPALNIGTAVGNRGMGWNLKNLDATLGYVLHDLLKRP
jgi:hypothetical protein